MKFYIMKLEEMLIHYQKVEVLQVLAKLLKHILYKKIFFIIIMYKVFNVEDNYYEYYLFFRR